MKHFLFISSLLFLNSFAFSQSIVITRVAGPITLSEPVFDSAHQLNLTRGLFADVIVKGNSVWTTYQIAPDTTLSYGKSVWYKKFDRNLFMTQGQTNGIDVFADTLFSNDLGDHQFSLLNDTLYTVAIIKNHDWVGVMKYDTLFQRVGGPIYVGDLSTDVFFDMGIGNDGTNVYTQIQYKPNPIQEYWGAKVFKINPALTHVLDSVIAYPDTGSFVTGTSIVYTPVGEIGATEDKLNIFSTDKMYDIPNPVNIHTFAVRPDLSSINGSTQVVIAEDKDVYWPCGVSVNYDHDLWVIGYTKEMSLNVFPGEELGASFVKVFDANWSLVDSISLNNGDSTFRVMTETVGDDIYVVYDEMNKAGNSPSSSTKIEHFKISTTASDNIGINKDENITIYPNPSKEKYNVSGIEEEARLQIFDIQGELVEEFNVNSSFCFSIENKGLYLIKIHYKNNVITKRISKV